MATHTLDFEKPLLELEKQIEELKRLAGSDTRALEEQLATLRVEIYRNLTPMERGQAEAIASSLIEMASLPTPTITAVIGEGGSGGALAVGLADRVLMLENSVYSVISPEGCAAILWKDASQRERAAEALKITAEDLLNLGVIDEIVPEPPGGAHADPEAAATSLGEALQRHLGQLRKLKVDKLLKRREEKYLSMGALTEK